MTTLPQNSPMRLPRPTPSHLAIPSANGHTVHAPSQQPAAGLTGHDVWRVIRSNLWLIIGLMAVGAVAGYFINVWLAASFARYTSTAFIRVNVPTEVPQIGEENRMLVADPSPQSIEVEQQTQAASIVNRFFLGQLIENPESAIRKTDWFNSYHGRADDAKEDLLDKLEVTPRPNSRLISVSFSCSSPRDAVAIVREIVEHHVAERQRIMKEMEVQKSKNLSGLIEAYQITVDGLKVQMGNRQKDLAKYYSTGDGTSNGLVVEVANNLQAMEMARRDWINADGELQAFDKAVKENLTPRLVQEELSKSASAMQANIDMLESSLVGQRAQLGADNPKVKAAEAELKQMKETDEERQAINKDRITAAIRIELKSKVDAADKHLAVISRSMEDLRGREEAMTGLAGELAREKDEEKATAEELEKAKREYEKLNLFIASPNLSTAEVANPADLPEKPSFPKLPITMTVAIALGLVLALSIAFLRELMDTSVRSPRDIARVGQLNLLGLIPHEADDPEAAGARLPLAIYEAPQSIIAEQFRQVRTRLQHSASLDTIRSLMVTGTAPGDGKTTVACNLAAGLALNGRRILLVDANFRRPELHNVFKLSNDVGFGDVLNALDTFDQAVRESEVPNLSVITSGARPSNSTELLESQLLIDFIERALEEYDHVIFDTGPLLIVSETAALAPRVDGVVTVVRARGNSRGMLQRLRDQLRQLKAENLGVILNAVRSHTGGYYAPMIKSYYAYQNR